MIYSNYEFLLLLPPLVVWFYALRSRLAQNILILLASVVFLAWTSLWNLAPVALVLTVGFVYFRVQATRDVGWRGTSLAVCLLVLNLGWLKYRWFFASILGQDETFSDAIIPLGISFYTFEAISAILDVHRRRVPVRPLTWSLFIMFLPHLIAGPIVRLRLLGHQFESRKFFQERNLFIGAHLFTIGFIKKLIADPIGSIIAPVWAAPAQATSGALVLALLGFSAQLFFDFSGYTDMARGIARMLGFRLPINFRAPFFARNPGDYYQRWHVSLSSWIRTFIYDTLAVAVLRRVRGRRNQNIALLVIVLFVMALFGLWHGAAWHFVLFGIAQGCVIAGWAVVTRGRKPRSNAAILGGMLLLQLTWLFSLIMFRADNVRDIGRYLAGLVHGGDWAPAGLEWCLAAMLVMVLVQAVDFNVKRRSVARPLCAVRGTRGGMAIIAVVFLSALILKINLDAAQINAGQASRNTSSFIYFRF